jgi:hypothetical protein
MRGVEQNVKILVSHLFVDIHHFRRLVEYKARLELPHHADATGRGAPQGNTVTYPTAAGFVTVKFSAAATALAGPICSRKPSSLLTLSTQ